MVGYLFFIFIFSLLLIKATDVLIVNLQSLARRTRVGQFAITGLVLALATSLPEFFVGVTAALEGSPHLSLGNVIGSNIANLSLVIGGAALISGTVHVRGVFFRREVFYAFLAGIAPLLLCLDRDLSRVDGLILLALYGFYQVMVFGERKKRPVEEDGEGFVSRLLRRLNHRSARRELGWIFLGVALLLLSAEMLVRLAKGMALALNVPLLVVGLLLVAVGTSLPELGFSIKAIRERRPAMVFGNLLGSIVANGTLIVGVTSLISPIKIAAFADYLLATAAFVVIFALFYFFVHTKRRLERWEGGILVLAYLLFAFLVLR